MDEISVTGSYTNPNRYVSGYFYGYYSDYGSITNNYTYYSYNYSTYGKYMVLYNNYYTYYDEIYLSA